MNLSPLPIQKFFGNDGQPLVGGLLFTYVAGTSTKIATYTDSTGGTPNTNPILLNYRGECAIWLDPTLSYKFVLAPSTDTDPPSNAIWTVDNIRPGIDLTTLYPRTSGEIAAGITPTNYLYPPGNVKRYGALGDGSTNDATAIQNAINCLPASGGEIVFPSGDYVIASTITMSDRRSIKLIGPGKTTSGATMPAILRCTQTSGTRIFDCRTSTGITFTGLMILQTGSGFTGYVIDFSQSPTASDSAFCGVRDCYMLGVGSATALIYVFKSHSIFIDGNNLVGGSGAIVAGTTDYANRIYITNNQFINQSTAPILEPIGYTWYIASNTFEPRSDGSAAAVQSSIRVLNMVFTGNWCGDANGSGTWINVAAIDASIIEGNLFDRSARGIYLSTAATSSGLIIQGNTFSNMTTAFDLTTASGWGGVFLHNKFTTVTNKISGSIPLNGNQTMLSEGGSIYYQGTNGIEFGQVADFSAPASTRAILYTRDNGLGKTQLVVRFNSGAIQVIATQP